jgi:acetolactate synthase-1/2/3 large subunit
VPYTVADHIALALRRQGVECVFGQSLPNDFQVAAERHGIRVLVYRSEDSGAGMADGYARTSRRVGVVAAQIGPGATLLVPPLVEALRASTPMLALVQDVARTDHDCNRFQAFDYKMLFNSCTKGIQRLNDSARIEADIALALVRATSGRPGPVALLVPSDLLVAPAVEQPVSRTPLGICPLDRPRPSDGAINLAAELIASAQHPLVIAGGGIHGSGASQELALLQELASLPVATTTVGKGAVSERHELSVGTIGYATDSHSLSHSLSQMVAGADVILLLGIGTNDGGADSWRLLPEKATYVQLDIDPEEVGRNCTAVRLVGDVRTGLEALINRLKTMNLSLRNQSREATVTLVANVRQTDWSDIEAVALSGQVPIRPEHVMSELNRLLTADDIVVADESYATIWTVAYLRSQRAGQRFLLSHGLPAPGCGLPLALGAKVAFPDQIVLCLTSDGAFAHNWKELTTAVRESLPVTIILLNNGVLGLHERYELNGFSQCTPAIKGASVDHVAIARACGAAGLRVDEPAHLHEALAEALVSDVPTLVEVMTDPAAYPAITQWDHSEALAVQTQAALHVL